MLDYLLENFDSIDLNQPRFYSRPCTRCLKCHRATSIIKRRSEAQFWHCDHCEEVAYWKRRAQTNPAPRKRGRPFVAVGLGALNQITGEIIWTERHETANEVGTPMGFEVVEAEVAHFGVDELYGISDDSPETDHRLVIYALQPPSRTNADENFTSLTPAIIYALRYVKNSPGWYFELKLDDEPLSHEQIMDVFAPSR